jgi:hypothetical protein
MSDVLLMVSSCRIKKINSLSVSDIMNVVFVWTSSDISMQHHLEDVSVMGRGEELKGH